MNPETKIGLVVTGGLLILAIGIFALGDIQWQSGYEIKVMFNDVSGLPEKAPVKSAGVDIGKVQKIDLVGNKAQVTVWIKEEIKIHRDSKVTIVSTGVIGTKYMELTLGSQDESVLKEGDILIGIDPMTFDKVISEGLKGFNDLADSIKAFTGDEDLKGTLVDVLSNIRDVSASLKDIVEKEESNIHAIVENFKVFSDDMKKITANVHEIVEGNRDDVEATLKNFKAVSEKMNSALDSIDAIVKKVEAGEGMLGTLIADDEASQDVKKTIKSIQEASNEARKVLKRISHVKTYWDYQLNYNDKDQLFRSDFGLQFRPNPTKFYYLGVHNVKEKEGSDYDEGDQRINGFTAKMGRDFGPVTVYGGLINSSGGVGGAFRPFNNRIFAINAEAFRFSRKVEGKSRAWINTGGSLRLLDWCYLKANVEDILEAKTITTSLNLVIEDEDLAYLLGLTGLSSLTK
ncbi:MAG: MlaD family protein [bacterium]